MSTTMSTRHVDGHPVAEILAAHVRAWGDADHICVHVHQHGTDVRASMSRAQLEYAAMRYEQPDARHWTIIEGLWLDQIMVHELLVQGWGENE